MKLTEEERAELAQLEDDVKKELASEKDTSDRQHFEALKLRKKHAKLGKHGGDYAVVETKIGNFVLRKPKDVEIDKYFETPDDRSALETFISGLVVEPTSEEVRALYPENPGLAGALNMIALELAKVSKDAEAKK